MSVRHRAPVRFRLRTDGRRSRGERGLHEPEARSRLAGRHQSQDRVLWRPPRRGRGCRAPDRARRRALQGAGGDRRGGRAGSRRPRPDRALAQHARVAGARGGEARAARRPAHRGLRHRVSLDAARRGADVRGAAPMVGGVGNPPFRLPRALGPVVGGARPRPAARRVSPGRWLLRHGRARGSLDRHQHGLQSAGGRADGSALRVGRPGTSSSSCARSS